MSDTQEVATVALPQRKIPTRSGHKTPRNWRKQLRAVLDYAEGRELTETEWLVIVRLLPEKEYQLIMGIVMGMHDKKYGIEVPII